MIMNDRLFYNSYEMIGGEKIMAPSASAYHNTVMGDLYIDIKIYLRKNDCGYVFTDNVDVHLPDGNLFKPDLVVVMKENNSIIDWNGAIHGVPDMVVEVLSKSTRKKDLTVKKDIYECNGVKEYWIVDPYMESIDAYILQDGKYYLAGEYTNYTDEEFNDLPEDDKAEVKFEISPSIFPDLKINVKDIFAWKFFSWHRK